MIGECSKLVSRIFIFKKKNISKNILASTWTFLRAAVGSNLHLSNPVIFSKIYRLILMSSSNVTQATFIYIYEELCDIIAKDTTLYKMFDTKPDKFILGGMSLCETRYSAFRLSWPLITLGLYMITRIILWKIWLNQLKRHFKDNYKSYPLICDVI